MADCLNCGASVASDAKYCRSCGAPLSGPSPVQSSAAAHVSAPVNASAPAPDGVRDAQPRKSGWADLGSVSVSAVSQGQQNQPAQASNPIQHGQVQQPRIQHGMPANATAATQVSSAPKKDAGKKSKAPIIAVIAAVILALVVLFVINPFGGNPSSNPPSVSASQLSISKSVSSGGTATIVKGAKTEGEATSHPNAGDTVYVEITPNDGYKLTKANYKTASGLFKGLTKVSAGADGKTTYSFTMPSENVTLNIEFEKK